MNISLLHLYLLLALESYSISDSVYLFYGLQYSIFCFYVFFIFYIHFFVSASVPPHIYIYLFYMFNDIELKSCI